jgi:mono/diheme cytochrome c family protein
MMKERIVRRVAIVLAMAALCVPAALAQTPKEPAAQKPAAAAPASDDAPAGNAENGKKLYVDRGCWMCHGFEGHGGEGPGGPRIVAGRLPSWKAFSKYVRRPTNQMIPYPAKILADPELVDIYAWLRTIPPPGPVTVPRQP